VQGGVGQLKACPTRGQPWLTEKNWEISFEQNSLSWVTLTTMSLNAANVVQENGHAHRLVQGNSSRFFPFFIFMHFRNYIEFQLSQLLTLLYIGHQQPGPGLRK
jgi:hypothetical protein